MKTIKVEDLKYTEEDMQKDWEDFRDTFNSYNGLSPSTLNNEVLIQWMMAVTDELKRLHIKQDALIREYLTPNKPTPVEEEK